MDMMKLMMAGKGGEAAPEAAGDDLTACCHDLIAAVHAKDSKACAEAMRACVACCEAEPETAESEKE